MANKIMSRSVKYTEVQKSLLRTELIRMQPTTFVNAAGPSNVMESLSDHATYVEFPWQQCLAQLKLLNELPDPPNYIFISSGSVYGNTSILGAAEEQKLSPLSPYAKGKLLAESKIQEYSSNYRGNIILARCFSVYDHNLRTRLPYLISQKMLAQKAFSLYGTGRETRDYIHLSDVAQSFHQIINQNYKFRIFNIGTGIPKTVMEVCEIAALAYGQDFQLNESVQFTGESRNFDPENLVADISALNKIGFQPEIKPEIGLLRYFKSIKIDS
jgi:nucleoside-diphosphate-sugar epimerase